MDGTTEALLNLSTPEQLVEIHNAIPGIRPVSRMTDRKTAISRVAIALERTGMTLVRCRQNRFRVAPEGTKRRVRVLVEQNPKRGLSRARFALYRNGMSTVEYTDACEQIGHTRNRAAQDLVRDRQAGLIEIYEGTA